MTDIGSIPSDTGILHVRFYVGTIPTEDPAAWGSCRLEIFVAPSNTIAANEGYHCGFAQKGADATHKLSRLSRTGDCGVGSIVLAGDWVVLHAYFTFDGTTLGGAQLYATAQNGNFESTQLHYRFLWNIQYCLAGVCLISAERCTIWKARMGRCNTRV